MDWGELEKLRAAATPGPWTPATAPAEGSDETPAEYLTNALRPGEGRSLWVAWAATVEGLHDGCDYVVPVVTGDGPASEANARYVAAMHAALPALLAAARDRDRLAAAITALADELARDAQSARNDARAIGPGGDSEQATYWHSQADAASDAAARLRALLTTTDEGETK